MLIGIGIRQISAIIYGGLRSDRAKAPGGGGGGEAVDELGRAAGGSTAVASAADEWGRKNQDNPSGSSASGTW